MKMEFLLLIQPNSLNGTAAYLVTFPIDFLPVSGNLPEFPDSCRPEVDLVFVHGLRGSPFRTWRSRTDEIVEGKQTDCWPRV